MRNRARRLYGEYFVPGGDTRRVNNKPTRSFNKSRSFVEGLIESGKSKWRSKYYVPKGKGVTHYEKQDYTRGGGKRKRRKTQRKPRKTRRTKRRTRKSRR